MMRTVAREIEFEGQQVKVEAVYGVADSGSGPYFSLTGSVWAKQPSGRFRHDPDAAGQVTDEILAAFPWLGLMARVHLDDAVTGEPMHAVANAWYWFSAEKASRRGHEVSFPPGWASMTRAQRAASYLGVDPSFFEGVQTREDMERVVDSLRPRWAAQAAVVRALYALDDEAEGTEEAGDEG